MYLEFQQAVHDRITNALKKERKKKERKKDELKSRKRLCIVRHRMTHKNFLTVLLGPVLQDITDFSSWKCTLSSNVALLLTV